MLVEVASIASPQMVFYVTLIARNRTHYSHAKNQRAALLIEVAALNY
jgi:hypothetical protein